MRYLTAILVCICAVAIHTTHAQSSLVDYDAPPAGGTFDVKISTSNNITIYQISDPGAQIASYDLYSRVDGAYIQFTCKPNTTPNRIESFVTVMYYDGSGSGGFSSQSGSGASRTSDSSAASNSTDLPISFYFSYAQATTVGGPLYGGTVLAGQYINYGKIFQYIESVYPAFGGAGSGYVYHWQSTTVPNPAATEWETIDRNSEVLYIPDTLRKATYFRRGVTLGGQVKYSNTVLVNGGNYGGVIETVADNNTLNIRNVEAASFDNALPVYRWEQSIDGRNWSTVQGATSASYSRTINFSHLYFRRVATASVGNKSACSNVVFADFRFASIGVQTKTTSTGSAYFEDRTYYDGLGREMQHIGIGSTPAKADFIRPMVYDRLGRTEKSLMPFPKSGNNGALALSAENLQRTYYAGLFESSTSAQPYAYTRAVYDASPLNRVVKTYKPGSAYQTPGGEHVQSTDYAVNESVDAVFLFSLNSSGAVTRSSYPVGTLFKTSTTDEDEGKSITFVDSQNRTVLQRAKDGNLDLDTYYVYDDFGRLVLVIPPQCVPAISVRSLPVPATDTLITGLCYLYKYDARGNLSERKLPGRATELMTYDAGNRLTARTLSSSARLTYDYDVHDRVEKEKLVRDNGTITTAEYRYDSHSATPPALQFAAQSGIVATTDLDTRDRGLKTYEKLAVLSSDASTVEYVERAFYYDAKGRTIQTVERNAANGISRTSFRFDFPGNLLAVCESHKPTATHTADLLTTHYRYDHRGRLLADSTILNGGTAVVARYQYDELGQQTSTSTLGGTLQTSRSYNIQGWLTSQYTQRSGVVFNSQLRYYDPQYGTDRSYAGNISEWTWKNGSTAAQNTYAFTYDQLSRLDDTKQYVNGSLNNQFVEKGIDYDRNGNVLSLQRTANGTTTENLTYAYSGNRLVSLSGTTSGTYDYDARGNMTRDGVQNLDIGYNHLDLIEKVERNNAVLANYSYLSDGTKLSATDSSGDGLVYAGSLVYRKQNGILSLESAAFSNGRIVATGTTFAPDYYVTDHLGSVRTIIDGSGTIKERNDYYPYGMRWSAGTSTPDNRYRYNAKEEQTFVNVPYIDYGFRQYDPKYRLQWNGNDLLAEKSFSVGTAVFCSGNPVRFVDYDGRKVSIATLSITHQQALNIYMKSKTGRAFIGRYMSAGESLTVNGITYTFHKTGDRAKDLLSLQTSSNLGMGVSGSNRVLIKGSKTGREINETTKSEINAVIERGVQQTIMLSNELDTQTAVGVLGHETFVHADKDADALTELDKNQSTMTQGKKLEVLTDISTSGAPDHKALGEGLVIKFKQLMNELTNLTGDKYYEQEYKRQVNDYKNR